MSLSDFLVGTAWFVKIGRCSLLEVLSRNGGRDVLVAGDAIFVIGVMFSGSSYGSKFGDCSDGTLGTVLLTANLPTPPCNDLPDNLLCDFMEDLPVDEDEDSNSFGTS